MDAGAPAKDDGTTNEPDFTQDSLIWALATACQQGRDKIFSSSSFFQHFFSKL